MRRILGPGCYTRDHPEPDLVKNPSQTKEIIAPAQLLRFYQQGRSTMPLIADGKGKAVAHGELRAIGFWMTVKGATPVKPVRVFVSYEVLADLDPSDIRDLASAFEHFERFRDRIEAAASDKFDRQDFDADKYEGMPTIRLTTNDSI